MITDDRIVDEWWVQGLSWKFEDIRHHPRSGYPNVLNRYLSKCFWLMHCWLDSLPPTILWTLAVIIWLLEMRRSLSENTLLSCVQMQESDQWRKWKPTKYIYINTMWLLTSTHSSIFWNFIFLKVSKWILIFRSICDGIAEPYPQKQNVVEGLAHISVDKEDIHWTLTSEYGYKITEKNDNVALF